MQIDVISVRINQRKQTEQKGVGTVCWKTKLYINFAVILNQSQLTSLIRGLEDGKDKNLIYACHILIKCLEKCTENDPQKLNVTRNYRQKQSGGNPKIAKILTAPSQIQCASMSDLCALTSNTRQYIIFDGIM